MIEFGPVTGNKFTAATNQAGLTVSSIPTLLVAVGRRYGATLGFETEANAKKAARLVKKTSASRKAR